MKLNIYVCEFFASDYEQIIKSDKFTDVSIKRFPCFCNTGRKFLKDYSLYKTTPSETDTIVICAKQCPILKVKDLNSLTYRVISFNYAFSPLISEQMIEFIIENGGYIITNEWLKRWKSILKREKFDQVTAQKFYGEFCKNLVLLDTGFDDNALNNIQELSEYLNIPFKRINIGLDNLRIFLRSLIFEWQLQRQNQILSTNLNEMRKQSAEYSAVLNIIEEITGFNKRRDIIEKLKLLFQQIFGAQKIRYLDNINNADYLESTYKDFILDSNNNYLLFEDQNKLSLKITHESELFGIIEASEFLFPSYLKKYTNFASSIARVSGLVFFNALQFELLEQMKDQITYTSYHDTLTNLYNRNYYIDFITQNKISDNTVLFICDIDNLKTVNDVHGHFFGDELICMAADVLSSHFRESDIVARIGGDEFAIIQFNSSLDLAQETKKRINDAIDYANSHNKDKPFTLSISIGYSINDSIDDDWLKLANTADSCMYKEKTLKKSLKKPIEKSNNIE